ncbi:MAG: phosphoglycerate dehydrogenase [Bacteroidota bacterium]
MKTILITASRLLNEFDRYRDPIDEAGFKIIMVRDKSRVSADHILPHAGKFDGCICGDEPFSYEVLAACAPRLKVISKWGTGMDSIDLEGAQKLGIKVCNSPGAFTVPVAETALAFIFAFARNTVISDREMHNGSWNRKRLSSTLNGKKLGVIGAGKIGQHLLKCASGLGLELFANDPKPLARDFIEKYHVSQVSLTELLEVSDYVSCCCDLNTSSYHLIASGELRQMKNTAILINVARGPVVDEKALPAALKAGEIGGAGLDVFELEPLPDDSPLRGFDNVIMSPHNASSDPECYDWVQKNTIRNCIDNLQD